MSYGIFTNKNIDNNKIEFCVVSDIHIAKGKRNDYIFDDNLNPLTCEAYMLNKFCNGIIESGNLGLFNDNKHKLILLGDVVNGGECGYFDSYNSFAYKKLKNTLSQWLYTGNILYFAGNHDKRAYFYSSLTGFPRNSVIETIEENTRSNRTVKMNGIIFEHGNKFDCLCNGKTILGLSGDFASNVVAKLCTPNLEDILRGREFYYPHSLDNDITAEYKETDIKSMNSECRRVANGALKLLNKHNDCSVIVCGHTHQTPVKVVVDKSERQLTYFNTGKFARDGEINITMECDKDNKWHLI